jgi:methylase of polypeptide subunit release factors
LAASGAVKILSKLGSISGGKVLDVATGSGDFVDTLMKALKDYDCFVGIDISAKDLESSARASNLFESLKGSELFWFERGEQTFGDGSGNERGKGAQETLLRGRFKAIYIRRALT